MDFDERIIRLESEIASLKTQGLRSSSSLALTSQKVTVEMQIVGYTVNYLNDNCAGQKSAFITLTPADGKNMLTMACASSADNLVGRNIALRKVIIGDKVGYIFQVIAGSPDDLAIIQAGGSIPAFEVELIFTATSEFMTTLTYRTDY